MHVASECVILNVFQTSNAYECRRHSKYGIVRSEKIGFTAWYSFGMTMPYTNQFVAVLLYSVAVKCSHTHTLERFKSISAIKVRIHAVVLVCMSICYMFSLIFNTHTAAKHTHTHAHMLVCTVCKRLEIFAWFFYFATNTSVSACNTDLENRLKEEIKC